MKAFSPQLFRIFLLFFATNVFAKVHYVDLNSTNPTPPFSDWSTAATNIQSALDLATNGDMVLVTNGIYQVGGRIGPGSLTNRVVVSSGVTLQSVNGPAYTTILGYQVPGTTNGVSAIRCAYLNDSAVLSGFTLTNGATFPGLPAQPDWFGGGVYCGTYNAIVTNCVIAGNASAVEGGGVFEGTIVNSVLQGNTSTSGGGVYAAKLSNCYLISNSANMGGGMYGGTSVNSAIIGNSASTIGGGLYQGGARNSTFTANTAKSSGGGAYNTVLDNCILYFNSASNNVNYVLSTLPSAMNYCCTIPMPSSGAGNFTNDPAFVNLAGSDFHLQSNSPCINSGNNSSIGSPTDLDGNPRIVGGTVDIGAYEYQTPASVISYAWLDQYGLATDGSVDFADLDGTTFNVYQDWIAGLNPTNAASVLLMQTPLTSASPTGVTVSWLSVNNRTYYLQQSTNLVAQPPFSTIQSNIAGQAGTTSFTDTTATNGGPYFYRVGVQH